MQSPDVGSTVAVIRAKASELGPRERAVADVLVAHPLAIVDMSASEVAALAGTSAATVTRACQSLGFSGFPHVRTLLVRDAGASAGADRTTVGSHPVQRMYADAARELEAAAATVDVDEFDRCADAVAGAKRIVLVGSGSSAATVASTALRFLLSGVAAEGIADPMQQLLVCRLLGPADVAVAVSDSGENEATLTAARAARDAGAQVIAVTSFPRSRLVQSADFALIVGASGRPWPESVLTSTLLQTFLTTALVVAVTERRGHAPGSLPGIDEILRAVTASTRPGI